MSQQVDNARPYRSHLRPACNPCRKRKSRCQTEPSSEICLMCRAHFTDCVFPPTSSSGAPRTPEPGRRRRQADALTSRGRTSRRATPASRTERTLLSRPSPSPVSARVSGICPEAFRNTGWCAPAAPEDESPLARGSQDDQQHNLHIIGPAATKDDKVLTDYLSAIPGATRGSVVPVPGSQTRPVLFTMVQKRPIGLAVKRSPAADKLEMIEKLLEPYCEDAIDLYFLKANRCLPLVDEASFRRQYSEDKERISPALLSCLYAHSLTYWRSSSVLARHRCPDTRFIWNLTNDAIYSDLFLSPGLSLIEAILLNVGGRPTTSLIGNGVLLGSAVSMAQSLGLNHSPLLWEIPQSEKHLRMKIWWVLLLHDRWMSLAHGTPPHISRTQFDVPQPSVEYLCDKNASARDMEVASIFVALVRLTDVLNLHLVHIHDLCKNETRSTTHLELALNNWVESLDDTIRRIIIRGTNLDISGAANLRLAYLTLRLLLQRIELEEDKKVYDTQDSRLLNRYIAARRTSEEILILTQELQPQQLADFWLPGSAFAFPATVSFLLRCALETENSAAGLAQSSSFKIACDLISALGSHQENSSWDLSDICLAQHGETVEKLKSMVPAEGSGTEEFLDMQDFIMPDVSIVDQFFPSLWDPLQSAW